jgi:RHS repeat-associated protein
LLLLRPPCDSPRFTGGGLPDAAVASPLRSGGIEGDNDTTNRKRRYFHHRTWWGNTFIDDYREFDANKLTWTGDSAQTFTYDHLDRLTHAQATGGPASYNRTYAYDKIGNITHKDGMGNYTYLGNGYTHGQPHAVTHIGGQRKYWYDPNGNMTQRIENGKTYVQGFNAENKLQTVTEGGQTTTFTYDGDGVRVKKVDPSGTTTYVGGYYEVQGGTVTKYYRYCAMSSCPAVAMRRGPAGQAGTVTYIHGDHLGSTSLTTDANGAKAARVLYYPYGEERYREGTLQTDYQFTGQRKEGFGLYDYRARFYDPSLGRFISADTIVPEPFKPQDWNRYAYVRNSPSNYIDPDGHVPLLVTALIGAGIGATVSTAVQVGRGMTQGQTFQESFNDVDWGQVAGAAVAGGVVGLTMGAGAAVLGTGFGATVFLGAAGGVLGGQAGALTEAGYDEVVHMLNSGGFDGQRYMQTAQDCGFLDGRKMAADAAAGGIAAGVGYGLNSFLGRWLNIPTNSSSSQAAKHIVWLYPQKGMMGIQTVPGKMLMMPISESEQFMMYLTEMGYEAARGYLEELIGTGVATWVEAEHSPTTQHQVANGVGAQ